MTSLQDVSFILESFSQWLPLPQIPWYHWIVEIGLAVWIIKLLFFSKSYNPGKKAVDRLTTQEEDELIDEWNPEPLVPDADDSDDEEVEFRSVTSKPGGHIVVDGHECINLASLNFLGMLERPQVTEKAISSLRKYGVGSCGPRGFYGTIDVHLDLEKRLSQFMGTEESILYSYGFTTMSTALPAYAKKGDVIFCDEGSYMPIQKGLIASRSKVYFYKHNDMEDLERQLEVQAEIDAKNPAKAKVTRRFLATEGVFFNYGDICPLPKLVQLKKKYKFRIFLDESISIGTLGTTGRGVTEYWDVPVSDVDCICGTLEYGFASVGGFATGTHFVVNHQRLSAQGYCFSASLPPMLAAAAMEGLDILDQNPKLLEDLSSKIAQLHDALKGLNGMTVCGSRLCPVVHLRLKESTGSRKDDVRLLQTFSDQAMKKGVAIVQAKYLDHEEAFLPPPSIRLSVNIALSMEELKQAASVIHSVARDIMKGR
ncbi:serine palmitoyltransferase 1-like [Sycon ciliatum]|uniref:serine palmitoyltransferase 1-like n=1 Tax=Sycon ciliatum TaxID=27933 RepID=UPI0020A8A44E|eukprot:scpid57425/ scgid26738/ Serine palmitoyltransferase 1; Long chain base biosynthesis protein 1; Serine-palmitoyl-CoA transferase 1